jgi:WD40 repeat protein
LSLPGPLLVASFSSDGGLLVTTSSVAPSGDQEAGQARAHLWDVRSGELLSELTGHQHDVWLVAFSFDGRSIATAPGSRQWRSIVTAPREAPTGGFVAAVGEPMRPPLDCTTVRIWDAGRRELATLNHSGVVLNVAFSPIGDRIVTTFGGQEEVVTPTSPVTAALWQWDKHKNAAHKLANLDGHRGDIQSIEFSSDGQKIATASKDGTVRLWNAATGKNIGVLGEHGGVVSRASFSPDDGRVVTASADGKARVWDLAKRDEPIIFEGHGEAVVSAEFSPRGDTILSASNHSVRLWEARTGKELAVFSGHGKAIAAANFSPDGTRVLTASYDGTARLWSIKSNQVIAVLKGYVNPALEFRPSDGLSGTIGTAYPTRRTLAIFSRDGRRIVTVLPGNSAFDDNFAQLWDGTGRSIAVLNPGPQVSSAIFSANGSRLATTSWDHTLRLWDTETGALVGTIRGHDGDFGDAAFSPDGRELVTGSWDHTARVWRTFPSIDELVAFAKTKVARCLMPEERSQFFLDEESLPSWCIEMRKWPYDTMEWRQWLASGRVGEPPRIKTTPLVAAQKSTAPGTEATPHVIPPAAKPPTASKLPATPRSFSGHL